MKMVKKILIFLIIMISVILLIMLGYNFIIWALNLIEGALEAIVFWVKLLPALMGILLLLFFLLIS